MWIIPDVGTILLLTHSSRLQRLQKTQNSKSIPLFEEKNQTFAIADSTEPAQSSHQNILCCETPQTRPGEPLPTPSRPYGTSRPLFCCAVFGKFSLPPMDRDCSICLQEIKGSIAEIDGCQHQFCFPCISRWSDVENTCAHCDASVFSSLFFLFQVPSLQNQVFFYQNCQGIKIRPSVPSPDCGGPQATHSRPR